MQPKPAAFQSSNNRDGPWPIAAALYSSGEVDRRAGSPASISDRTGTPRWYALWPLIRYLRSLHRGLTSRGGRRGPSGVREEAENLDDYLSQTGGLTLAASQPVVSSDNGTETSAASTFAPRTSSTAPTVTRNTSGIPGGDATYISPNKSASNRSPGPSDPLEPHCDTPVQATRSRSIYSTPRLSDSRANIPEQAGEVRSGMTDRVTIPPAGFPVLGALINDMPACTDLINRLHNLLASKIKKNDDAQKSAQDQFLQGLCYVRRTKDKVQTCKRRSYWLKSHCKKPMKGRNQSEARPHSPALPVIIRKTWTSWPRCRKKR
jgi:hypothetical protein